MSPRHHRIGQEIRLARTRRGWSQEQAARRVGTSRFHWIKWEQGLHKPTAEFQKRLIRNLGLEPALFDEDDEERRRAMVLYGAVKDAIRELVA
jgi:transcriptional regulator with XRE-family HTH domain